MAISTEVVITKSNAPITSAKYYGKSIIGKRLPEFELSEVDTVGYCHIRFLPKNPIDTYTENSPFKVSAWDVVMPDYDINDDNLKVSLGTLAAGSYVIKAQRSFLSDAASFEVFVGGNSIASTGTVKEKDVRLEFALSSSSEVEVKLISYKFATHRTGGCQLRGLSITTADTEPTAYELPYYVEMPYTMAGIPVSASNTLATYKSSVDGKPYIADSCEYDGTNSYLYQRISGHVISSATKFKFVETADTDSYVVKCTIPDMKNISATDYDSVLCNALPTDHVDDAHEFKECIQALGKEIFIRIKKTRLPENPTIQDVQKMFRYKSMMVYYPRETVKITDLKIHLFHTAFSTFKTFKNSTLIETDESTNNGLSLEFEVTA